MRLLLKRHTAPNRFYRWRLDFIVWAQFELTAEEKAIARRFDMEKGYLTVEGSGSDLRRAFLFAIVPAAVANAIIIAMFGLTAFLALLALLLCYAGITWLIYEQIREAIKMNDIFDGRYFKNRSAMLMLRRERRIIGYALAFQKLLELLREQAEKLETVIELGEEEHAPALRLVTDTYAPA
jgi:hypothetical protein